MTDHGDELQAKVDELEDKVGRMVVAALETALTADDLEVRAARLGGFVHGSLAVYVDHRGVRLLDLTQHSPN